MGPLRLTNHYSLITNHIFRLSLCSLCLCGEFIRVNSCPFAVKIYGLKDSPVVPDTH